jgi:hypothetical protein
VYVLVATRVESCDDIGMIHFRRYADFFEKPVHETRIQGVFSGEQLQSHLSIHRGLPGEPDLPHCSEAELALEHKTTQCHTGGDVRDWNFYSGVAIGARQHASGELLVNFALGSARFANYIQFAHIASPNLSQKSSGIHPLNVERRKE